VLPWTRRLLRMALLLLLAGFLAGTFARFAPGFDFDEEQIAPGATGQSLARMRAERQREGDLLTVYPQALLGILRGDWGESRSLRQPVRQLIVNRAGVTAVGLLTGLAAGWAAAMLAALFTVRFRSNLVWHAMNAASIPGLALPAGLCAFLLLAGGAGGRAALSAGIALLVYSRLFPYFCNLLGTRSRGPSVLLARAKGVGPWRLLFRHTLTPAWPQIVALTSIAASVALSASIPLETILDQPGIGQLAWQAAVARDLRLLLAVTWILGAFLMVLNVLSDRTMDGTHAA